MRFPKWLQRLSNATIKASIAADPAVTTASGWTINNGEAQQNATEDPGVQQLRKNLAVLGGTATGITAAPLVATPTAAKLVGEAAASMLGGETVDQIHRGVTGQSFGRGMASLLGQQNVYDRSAAARFGYDMMNPGFFLGGLVGRGVNAGIDAAGRVLKQVPEQLSIRGRLPYWLSNKNIESKAISKIQSDGFDSTINWDPKDWFSERVGDLKTTNKDVRILNSHIPEYLNIEKQTKANGTFLKNLDGSEWIGDPRSWIQLQSRKGRYFVPESFVTRVNHPFRINKFYKYTGRSWAVPLDQAEYFSAHDLWRHAQPFEITYPKSAKTATIDASGHHYAHIPRETVPKKLLLKLNKNYVANDLSSDSIVSLADKAKIPIVKINNVTETLKNPVNDIIITGSRKSIVGNNGNFSRYWNRNNIYRKQGGIVSAQLGTKLLNKWQQLYDSKFGKGLRDFMYGYDHDLSDEEYMQKHGHARPLGSSGMLGFLVAPEFEGLEFPEITAQHFGSIGKPKSIVEFGPVKGTTVKPTVKAPKTKPRFSKAMKQNFKEKTGFDIESAPKVMQDRELEEWNKYVAQLRQAHKK